VVLMTHCPELAAGHHFDDQLRLDLPQAVLASIS
jgi:hypothetical protein